MMCYRLGLTRAEVVVGLATLAVVGGLALAAINHLREVAARTSCQNNLRQLILGVYSYNDANQKLPPLTDQGAGAPTGGGLPSVFATLGPYLEAAPCLYYPGRTTPTAYHADTSVPFTYRNKDNTTGTQYGGVANQRWRMFTDPSDAAADRLRDVRMTLPDGTTGYYATGSYAANGLLPWGIGGLQDSILHEQAGTIMFAERPQMCRTAAGEVVSNLWGVGFYSPHMPAFATLTPAAEPDWWSTGHVAPTAPFPRAEASDRNASILVRIGRSDAQPQPPDFPTPVQLVKPGQPCDPRLPGSPHRAGMVAAMSDGSVRLFAPNTEPWAFWATCTPKGAAGKAP
jgi:Protein of unknown function (DUF1559)